MGEWGIETRLKTLVEEYFGGRGLEIVEYSCRVEGRNFALRILADRREGGISMYECAGANRELALAIELPSTVTFVYKSPIPRTSIERTSAAT